MRQINGYPGNKTTYRWLQRDVANIETRSNKERISCNNKYSKWHCKKQFKIAFLNNILLAYLNPKGITWNKSTVGKADKKCS